MAEYVDALPHSAITALRMALRDMEAIKCPVSESGSLVGFFVNRLNELSQASHPPTGATDGFRAEGWIHPDGSMHKGCPPVGEPEGWLSLLVPVHPLPKSDAAPPTKAPKWYSRDEIVHLLKLMNYSDQIAGELADWMVRHLQSAFNKGFSLAQRGAFGARPAVDNFHPNNQGPTRLVPSAEHSKASLEPVQAA